MITYPIFYGLGGADAVVPPAVRVGFAVTSFRPVSGGLRVALTVTLRYPSFWLEAERLVEVRRICPSPLFGCGCTPLFLPGTLDVRINDRAATLALVPETDEVVERRRPGYQTVPTV